MEYESWLAVLESYPDDLWQIAGILRAAKDKILLAARQGISTNTVWLPSFVALGTVDALSVSRSASRAIPGLGVVGTAAGIGMVAASAQDYRRAESVEQKLDAGGDFAWGAQGLLYLGSSSQAGKAAAGIGVVGALIQTAAGVLRIKRGIQRQDGEMVKLGALDLGGGLLWLGWDLVGWQQPLFVATYVLLMVGREAFANKQALRAFGGRVEKEARMTYAQACESVGHDLHQIVDEIGRRAHRRGTFRTPAASPL